MFSIDRITARIAESVTHKTKVGISSNGSGRRPFKAEMRVRDPLSLNHFSGISSSAERPVWNRKAEGAAPSSPTKEIKFGSLAELDTAPVYGTGDCVFKSHGSRHGIYCGVAELVQQLPVKEMIRGSNPRATAIHDREVVSFSNERLSGGTGIPYGAAKAVQRSLVRELTLAARCRWDESPVLVQIQSCNKHPASRSVIGSYVCREQLCPCAR